MPTSPMDWGLRIINVANPAAPDRGRLLRHSCPSSVRGHRGAGRQPTSTSPAAGPAHHQRRQPGGAHRGRVLRHARARPAWRWRAATPTSPTTGCASSTWPTRRRPRGRRLSDHAGRAMCLHDMARGGQLSPTSPMVWGCASSTSPTRRRPRGRVLHAGPGMDVAVAGNYAYILGGPRRCASSTSPTQLRRWRRGLCDEPRAWPTASRWPAGYAYVADRYGGLRIINVANPAAPAEVGSYRTRHGGPWAWRWRAAMPTSLDGQGDHAHHQRRQPGRAGEVGGLHRPGTVTGCAARRQAPTPTSPIHSSGCASSMWLTRPGVYERNSVNAAGADLQPCAGRQLRLRRRTMGWAANRRYLRSVAAHARRATGHSPLRGAISRTWQSPAATPMSSTKPRCVSSTWATRRRRCRPAA